MKARPILMSAPMVRACWDGTKGQTRRALKKQPLDILPMEGDKAGREWVILEQREPEPKGKVIRCRYGMPGDLLWVRETWQHAKSQYCHCPQPSEPSPCDDWQNGTGCRSNRGAVVYAADDANTAYWRPSIHMPRWASRLTLRITNIRVERLQDISEADSKAEGVEPLDSSAPEDRESCGFDRSLCVKCGGMRLYMGVINGAAAFDTDCEQCDTHAKRYRWLWESINGAESWTANPWVWVIGFEAIKANVDQVMREAA